MQKLCQAATAAAQLLMPLGLKQKAFRLEASAAALAALIALTAPPQVMQVQMA
jgi:hypothetical protein